MTTPRATTRLLWAEVARLRAIRTGPTGPSGPAGRRRPTAAVVGGRGVVRAAMAGVLTLRAGASVTRLRAASPAELVVPLAAAGPLDLVVDLRRRPPVRARLRAVAYHCRRGGVVLARHDGRAPVRPPPRLRLEHGDGWLRATVGVAALVRLTEAQTTAVLTLAPGRGRTLREVPAGAFDSRCELRSNDEEVARSLPRRIEAGPLALRCFDDVTCAPGQVAYAGRLLLPATFRKAEHRGLRTPSLRGLGAGFARPPDLTGRRRLDGAWLYLDNVARGHFGHVLTEQLSQLWGWPEAARRHPGLRLLVGSRPGGAGPAGWELDLYAAAGVPRAAVHVVDGPVEVERLVTATPMYRLPDQVHPDLAALWDEVGRRLAAAADPAPRPTRVFLTRRTPNRRCLNTDEVEQRFRDHGFAVVRPEELALADQVALVRGADVVAGFAGSALFTTALAGGPRHVVTIGPASYTAYNEHLMASVLGHRLDMVVCRPDVPRGDRFDRRSFQSDFTLDWQGPDGAFLAAVLAGLAPGLPDRTRGPAVDLG